jgi:arsenate reductase-like glutaredoxin family protein
MIFMARLKTTKQINTNIKQIITNTPSINTLINNHNHSYRNISKEHNNSSEFTIYHQNIRGISKKADEFLISIWNNKPQIVCLTEHHLTAEEIKERP